MTVQQFIDVIIDEVDFNKPSKYKSKSVADIIEADSVLVHDAIKRELDEDAAVMLFEHYCTNKCEALNGYIPSTRDNVDILTEFYYDICDTARKYCADDE